MPPHPTIYSYGLVSPGTLTIRNSANMSEFTMQSRYITEEEARNRNRWFRLNLSGPLKNFPSNVCYLTYITTLVIKNNRLERLPPELGNLVNLVNLDASHNYLRSLPSTIGQLSDLRIMILNNNFLADMPVEFALLLNLQLLNLDNNPLAPSVASLYGQGTELNIRALLRHYIDIYWQRYIDSAPPQRNWRQFSSPSKDGCRITVMSYNVLSANYATAGQYPYCPSWAIDWEYRRRGILEELRHYTPSVICLQEIDADQYETVFEPELAKINYEGVFLPKSRYRTIEYPLSRKVDGCAIFWQKDKFVKVNDFKREYSVTSTSVCKDHCPVLLDRLMVRDNVAIGIILETKKTGQKFCVTTSHIHWDPEQSDVKLVQIIMWVSELWNFLERAYGKTGEPGSGAANMPVILCGDFNSLPTSGVIEYLSRGSVPMSHREFLNNGFQFMFPRWKSLEKWAYEGNILRHRFDFDRAYHGGADDGMRITNMTFDFKGMIDYIFFTKNHFRLLGSLDQIEDSWFVQERVVGCPHIHVPSDHFSLLVELDLLAHPGGRLTITEPPEASSSSRINGFAATPVTTAAHNNATGYSDAVVFTNSVGAVPTAAPALSSPPMNSPKPKGPANGRQKQGKRQQ